MADRYYDDLEDEHPDGDRGDRIRDHRPTGRKRRRRIRVTQDGMHDSSPRTDTDLDARARVSADYEMSSKYVEPAIGERDDYGGDYGDDEEDSDEYDESDKEADLVVDNDGEYRDDNSKRRVRPRAAYQDSASRSVGNDDRTHTRRPVGFPIRSRLPQIPIRGGLTDVVGRGRVAMTVLMGLLAFVGYNALRRDSATKTLASTTQRASTTQQQPIRLRAEHDMALGQKSVDRVLAQHDGLTTDSKNRTVVQQVGAQLVLKSEAGKTAYRFIFDVLADETNVDAFALPGGRIYLTAALLNRLQSRGEIAGILAREMAHVTRRHGMQRLENATLASGSTGAVVMASFLDPVRFRPTDNDVNHLIAETVRLRYEASEIRNSNEWAIHYMSQARFNPDSFVSAIQKVAQSDGQPTYFARRHQVPQRQLALVQQEIRRRFPQGVPSDYAK